LLISFGRVPTISVSWTAAHGNGLYWLNACVAKSRVYGITDKSAKWWSPKTRITVRHALETSGTNSISGTGRFYDWPCGRQNIVDADTGIAKMTN
jgi:hypothetical protein